jgi:hypothetical protein
MYLALKNAPNLALILAVFAAAPRRRGLTLTAEQQHQQEEAGDHAYRS